MLLTIAGIPMGEIGTHEIGEWTETVSGPEDLAWQMDPGPPDPRIKPGLLVELRDGGNVVWSGVSNRPNRRTGELSARGHAGEAYRCAAMDGSGNGTMVLDTAIDAAISRGALQWLRPNSISSTALTSDANGEIPTIGELLDAVTNTNDEWWRVGPDRVVETFAKPTSPKWWVSPDAGTLDVVEGDYASRLYGRRVGSAGGYSTTYSEDTDAEALYGYREDYTDLTGLGVLTAGEAQDILAGMLTKGRARLSFANSVIGSPLQIQTVGGIPAHLAAIKPAELARFMAQHDQSRYLQSRGYVDEMIGRVIHQGEQTTAAELQPHNLVKGADWRDAIAYMAHRKRRR